VVVAVGQNNSCYHHVVVMGLEAAMPDCPDFRREEELKIQSPLLFLLPVDAPIDSVEQVVSHLTLNRIKGHREEVDASSTKVVAECAGSVMLLNVCVVK